MRAEIQKNHGEAISSEHTLQMLVQEYQDRCRRNPRYSLRSFARSLEVSHSLLSMVLSGKRKPSLRMAALISQKVRPLSSRDSESVSNDEFVGLTQANFERIATWMHYAVLGLLHLPDFDSSARNLSKRLGISHLQAKTVWNDLLSSGTVKRKAKGWEQVEKRITLNNTSSTPATRDYVRGFLRKAEESLDAERFSARNLTTITFCMNEQDIPFAAKKIKDFRRKLCRELEERSQPTRVYTLAVQLFPITRKDEV